MSKRLYVQVTQTLPFFCMARLCSKWHKPWRSCNSSQTSLRSTTTNTASSVTLFQIWFCCSFSVIFVPYCSCSSASATNFRWTTTATDLSFLWRECWTVIDFNSFGSGSSRTLLGYCSTKQGKCLSSPSLSHQSLIHILRINQILHTVQWHKNKQIWRNTTEGIILWKKFPLHQKPKDVYKSPM